MVVSAFCTACGAALTAGSGFCSSCGTASTAGAEPTLIIGETAQVMVDMTISGGTVRGPIAPRPLVDRRTVLSAGSLVTPEPAAPWEMSPSPLASDPQMTALTGGPPKARPARGGSGASSVLLLLCAALLFIPAITSIWLYQNLHSRSSVTSMFASTNHNSQAAEAIGRAIATEVVNGKFARITQRHEIALRSASFVNSSQFDQAWRSAIGDSQQQAMQVANSGHGAVALDVTPVIDQLRQDGDVDPKTSVKPIVLVRSSYAEQIKGTNQLLARLALFLLPLSLVLFGVGIFVARNRLRALSVFAFAVAAIAAVSLIVTLLVPGPLAGAVATTSIRSAVKSAIWALTSRLAVVLAILALAGVFVAVPSLVIERHRTRLQASAVAWPGT